CLTVSQPPDVTAATGFDAIAHAVETYVTIKRNPISEFFSREAWRLLDRNYERVLAEPRNLEARGAMQLGAYYAGVAIENSMLGATHACANPLTARYGTTHGVAIAMLLPHVVRWNAVAVESRYQELLNLTAPSARKNHPAENLAARVEQLIKIGRLPLRLSAVSISKQDLPQLAEEAALQWTGRFNPRPLGVSGALEIYECAYWHRYITLMTFRDCGVLLLYLTFQHR